MPAANRRAYGSRQKENRDRAQGAGAEDGEDDGRAPHAGETQTLTLSALFGMGRHSRGGPFVLEVAMPAAAPAEKQLSAPRNSVAHAWLSAEDYERLRSAAADRRQHPDQMAALILVAVLHGALTEVLQRA